MMFRALAKWLDDHGDPLIYSVEVNGEVRGAWDSLCVTVFGEFEETGALEIEVDDTD